MTEDEKKKAAEARDYISKFHLIVGMTSPLTYVNTSPAGRIDFATMTDEDAIYVSSELKEIAKAALRRRGVLIQ